MNEGSPARGSLSAARFISSLWFGSGAFLIFVAAPAAFRGAPDATVAANVVGVMLARWHYLALAFPLILLVLEWRRGRPLLLVLLCVAIILAAAQAFVDLKIRAIRYSSPVPIHALSRDEPIRKRFGALHGLSSILLLAQIVAAGIYASSGDGKKVPVDVEVVDRIAEG